MDVANKPAIRQGDRLVIHPGRDLTGHSTDVTTEQVADGAIFIKGDWPELAEGDVVMLEHPVSEDARYLAPALVDISTPEHFSLRVDGAWERIQQRDYVRISTHGVTLTVETECNEPVESQHRARRARRRADRDPAEPRCFELLDVSAGGLRFQARERFEAGDAMRCRFALGGGDPYDLDALVVRTEPIPETSKRAGWVAAEFDDIDEEERSRLLQWIYREQVRRHKRQSKGRS